MRKQALKCKQTNLWMDAKRKEIESIKAYNVLEGRFFLREWKLLKTNLVYKI